MSYKQNDTDEFRENVYVAVQDVLPEDATLERYTELSLEGFKNHPNLEKMESVKDATIAGFKGKELTYTTSYDHIRIFKVRQYWFLRGNKAYIRAILVRAAPSIILRRMPWGLYRVLSFCKTRMYCAARLQPLRQNS